MGEKDIKAKNYLNDNERFADLCNYYYIHYAMPVRNMIYDALNYGNQVKEAAKGHKAEYFTDHWNDGTAHT